MEFDHAVIADDIFDAYLILGKYELAKEILETKQYAPVVRAGVRESARGIVISLQAVVALAGVHAGEVA